MAVSGCAALQALLTWSSLMSLLQCMHQHSLSCVQPADSAVGVQINIGEANAGDAFYRYKMPTLQARVSLPLSLEIPTMLQLSLLWLVPPVKPDLPGH